jgi:hypothetical protein
MVPIEEPVLVKGYPNGMASISMTSGIYEPPGYLCQEHVVNAVNKGDTCQDRDQNG